MIQKLLNKDGKSSRAGQPPSPDGQAGDLPDFETLLQAVGQKKDRQAFIKLFEYFAPRVKSFLIKNGLSPETADELAQETMLALWNKSGRYDPGQGKKQARGSIRLHETNALIICARQSAKSDIEIRPDILISEEASPREDIQAIQTADIIEEALDTLPPQQAELLHKSFFEGKSHGQISTETGIALGTVKSRIRAALERLRGNKNIKELET